VDSIQQKKCIITLNISKTKSNFLMIPDTQEFDSISNNRSDSNNSRRLSKR
jgi:hypothetical protein